MTEAGNPLLAAWQGPFGEPPFDAISPGHFLPALEVAIAAHIAEVEAIAASHSPPTFDNVVAALERAGALLGRVRRVFWTLSSARADNELRAIEPRVSALLTAHSNRISHDPRLFGRLVQVWQERDETGLDREQTRLLENVYRGFVRGGALLGGAEKRRFADIDARLAVLSVTFGHNVLAATNACRLLLGPAEISGLPPTVLAAARDRAAAAGHAEAWLFSADRGDMEDVLTFAADGSVRERMWQAFTTRCDDGGPHDNNAAIAEIVALRLESARLLGFASYADYVLADSMAREPETAAALLDRVWAPARREAAREAAELQALLAADYPGAALAPWDWRYYAEKVRVARYTLDGAAVKAHLPLDRVRTAAFDAAGRLYGLHFARRDDVAVYHPEVVAWEVTRARSHVGLLFTDYHARPEKHGGAWMGSLRLQERLDDTVAPIVYTVANFTRPPPGEQAHLSLDEARTLFHEFGHALHALLSDVTYPSLSGTSVCRDFVEFPSKFMEHWITAPQVLAELGMPASLIGAIRDAETAGQGFAAIELAGSSMVDLALHRLTNLSGFDADAFAEAELTRIGMPAAIGMRHRLPYFTHIFDGGYAAAYYSYLWSEVLDADAFDAFAEAGDIFDHATAERFAREVLSRGDGRDPMDSFIAFRGRPPVEEPLLRSRGLLAEEPA